MNPRSLTSLAARSALGAFVLCAAAVGDSAAQGGAPRAPAVDPVAVQLLRRSIDYVGSLKQFSAEARNHREDLLPTGNRVDYYMGGRLSFRRPDKYSAQRVGSRVEQELYFDGATLTLFNPPDNVYASRKVSGGYPEMFTFAYDSLGLFIPMSDLVWPNAFPLLMKDVRYATVIAKEVISGVRCTHLLFSRPGVDFQVWVADSGPPFPYQYIVTDNGTPERLSIVTTITSWKVETALADRMFTFVPPKGATAVSFLKPLGD
jgi:hypothetical protein